jgi:hypothetical protein
MSDTPRTDKAQKEYEDENYDLAVYPDFARQLERELTAANAKINAKQMNRLIGRIHQANQVFVMGYKASIAMNKLILYWIMIVWRGYI